MHNDTKTEYAEAVKRTNEFMTRLIDVAIRPKAHAIAEINIKGGIAVVVFEPQGHTADAARSLGWDGTDPAVLKMSRRSRVRLASRLAEMGDIVSRDWFLRKGPGRMWVLTQRGSLLLNFERGKGYFVEPGSTGRSAA